ncbi:MAG: glycosyltransferase family 9 protein [Bacteroidales bacterium]|nr:glycosyltransferase family 9 protein [Bacteroidales bacterium]
MVKFLVVRFSSIGDIVLTTPIVRCLKQQVEGAEVHFLTKPMYKQLIQHNPHIDKVLILQPKLSDTIKEIKAETYDYIIDLHHNLRTCIIKNRTQILAFSFPKLNWQKWLMVNFKINRLPNVHIVDRYFETVKLFDVQNDGKGLELHITENDEVELKNLPEFLWNGYWVAVIGAKHVTKKIPSDMLIRIIDEVRLPVVLLGDQTDAEKANEIITSTSYPYIYNACGQYSILQSASLIKQATMILTADTGLMHIAAAYQKKMVTVWGNTIPQFGMFPYMPKHLFTIHEVTDLPCRPCSKLGYKRCPKKHFNCMKKQNLENIVKQIKKFYAS